MSEKRNTDQVSVFDKINSICKQFQRAWKAGKRSRIEDLLQEIGEDGRPTLFSNLLQLEKTIREKRGERPNSREYIQRFPEHTALIRQAFFESTQMSMDGEHRSSVASDNSDMTQAFGLPSSSRLGDYELVRQLGRGGFGVVYEAQHRKRQNVVALKTLPAASDGQEVNADRLHRFRKEFRSLSEYNHPNLVGMQTLEVDDGKWFFTMDLIDGTDFLSYVRPYDELNENRLRASIAQLAIGIIALHEQGIVHRDLKPSNVMVETDGQVKILDFGLVAELQTATDQTASLRSAQFAGTPRYAAPEQMFGERTEATDWYACGVMLYEALTGEAPFKGNQMELLRQKQNDDPPLLFGREGVPEDLAKLADSLVRREPQERIAAAEIIKMLQLDLETRSFGSQTAFGSAGSHGSTGSVNEEDLLDHAWEEDEVELIGREEQLTQLEAAKQKLLEEREPVVVFIKGLSGEGKSSLAEKFLRPIRRNGEMLVLSGRCYDRESVPYKAIDSIIEPLVRILRSRRDTEMERLLPQDIEMLAHLFPILKRVPSIAKLNHRRVESLDYVQIHNLAFVALKDLLANISRENGLVIFVDDLQWGDGDSAEVLKVLLSPPDSPTILLIGSFRSDEVDDSRFLSEWKAGQSKGEKEVFQSQEILVSPLSVEQCQDYLKRRFGDQHPEITGQAERLFESSKGNPYFLEQLVEGFDPAIGEFAPVPLSEILRKRLDRCPADAADLLNAIAIAGKSVAVGEVAAVCDKSTTASATVNHMRSERLLRLIGDQGEDQLVDTYHDKIRESTLAQLSESKTRKLHLKFAELILKDCPDLRLEALEEQPATGGRLFDLAYHFHEAGDPNAFRYNLLAGEEAFRSFALEDALVYLKKAESLLPADTPPDICFRLWNSLGQVHLRLKTSEEYGSYFDQAIECAPTDFDRAKARTGLASMHMERGDFSLATTVYDQALANLGKSRPKSLFGCLFSISISFFRIFLIPTKWQVSRNEDRRRKSELELRIRANSAYYLFESNVIQSFDATLSCGTAAFRSGNPDLLVLAYGQMAWSLAMSGLSWLADICLRRTESIVDSVGSRESRATFLGTKGAAYYLSGKLEEAEHAYQAGIEDAKQCCQHSDLIIYFHIWRHLRSVMNSASLEMDAAKQEHEWGTAAKDARAICWGNYGRAISLSRTGELHESLKRIQLALEALNVKESRNLTEAICRGHHGFVLLQCSEYGAARAALERSWQIARSNFLYNDFSVYNYPLLMQSIGGPNWLNRSDGFDARYAKKLLRSAWVFHLMFPLQRPGIDRSRARLLWMLNRKRSALRFFRKAVKQARQRKMGWDLPRALLDLAAVQEEGREEKRREAIELLIQLESVIPRAESWLLGDQYDEAVVAPELDLEAWEREHGQVTPSLEQKEIQTG